MGHPFAFPLSPMNPPFSLCPSYVWSLDSFPIRHQTSHSNPVFLSPLSSLLSPLFSCESSNTTSEYRFGTTILHTAVRLDQNEVVMHLLSSHRNTIDVCKRAIGSRTPMDFAQQHLIKRWEVCQISLITRMESLLCIVSITCAHSNNRERRDPMKAELKANEIPRR